MLIGRDTETALLVGLLDEARHGTSRCLVVRGEPGVGKSALLEDLVARADHALALRTQGVEVEAPLAFAALHRLLLPVMRLRAELPGPQARALRVAFGEEEGPAVEPFLVGVATLSLLTAAAEESAVLCVVEDAHWLDSATTDALLFCARRLGADRVLLLFSVREGSASSFRPGDINELELSGLDPVAARDLLHQRLGDTPAEVAERLISESAGNPLALLELPTELSPGQLRGSSPLPSQLHLTSRVERAFLARSRVLDPAAQQLLLLAAADDTGRSTVLRRAAASLGLGEGALEGAEESGLLVVRAESVTVHHPLVRSAVYQAATEQQRRQVHIALADSLADEGDRDREAWHRAAAAEGPDPDVVTALDLVGSRAERRGAYVSALAAFERAATLTPIPPQRAALTLAAARNAWACGRIDQARTLLTATRRFADDPVLLSDVARLQGRIEVNVGSATDAHRIFTEAARAVSEVDPARALEMAVAAAVMRTYGADSGSLLEAGALDVQPADSDGPRTVCLKEMLVAMTRASEGDWAAAVCALDAALAVGDAVVDLDVLGNLGNAALQLGDDPAQQHFYTGVLSRAREVGAVMVVVYALQRQCFGHLAAGDWTAVRSNAEESLALCTSPGQLALTAPSLAWLTLLAALQGTDDFDRRVADLEAVVTRHALGILADPVHDLTRWAKGVRAASAGDHVGALHHLSLLRLPVLARLATTARIDAAVRAEEPDLARGWTEQVAEFAAGTRRPWALAAAAYGRAMTAGPDDAEVFFVEALDLYGRADRTYDHARVRLAYGEWLRRAQRRVDARHHLRLAVETFRDLKAHPLEERATAELRASGETARKRDPSTLVQLTPMELKVAQLVSQGLSNKDVASQIWVSPRTVAFHLRNVFAKAGVTSRGELAQLDLA